MNDIVNNENIESLIFEVRNKQVMLDSDLAKLYECANGTKTINLAVKRHINKFPERYMFQLTKEEFEYICGFNLKPQNNKTRKYYISIKNKGTYLYFFLIQIYIPYLNNDMLLYFLYCYIFTYINLYVNI